MAQIIRSSSKRNLVELSWWTKVLLVSSDRMRKSFFWEAQLIDALLVPSANRPKKHLEQSRKSKNHKKIVVFILLDNQMKME